MTKHGGSFQLSGDTRDLLRKHGDFFDQLTSLQGDDEASGQIPLKLKGKDPEAHTEAKIQDNGDVEVTFVYPVDSDGDATNGRIYLRDTFLFDASENVLKSFNRKAEYNGKGQGNWQAWLEKYNSAIAAAPLQASDEKVQKFAKDIAKTFSRPITDETGTTLPEIREVWVKDSSYITAANVLILKQREGDDQAPQLKLKIKDKLNNFALYPSENGLDIVFTFAVDDDDDPFNGRILLKDRFTVDPETFALKGVKRSWDFAQETGNSEAMQTYLDKLRKEAPPSNESAAAFLKDLLPVVLGDMKGASPYSNLIRPLNIPKDFKSQFAKRLMSDNQPLTETPAGTGEALEAMQSVGLEELSQRADASRGWYYRFKGNSPIDLDKQVALLQSLFGKANDYVKQTPTASAFGALRALKLEGAEAELRDRLLSDQRMAKIEDIGRESDIEIRAKEFLKFAREDLVKEAGFGASAQIIGQRLAKLDSVKKQAGDLLAILDGQGSVGAKMDFLVPSFVKQVADPKMLVAMGAAPFLGSAFEFGSLRAFGAITKLGRGTRLLSGLVGVGGEALAFTSLHRGLQAATHDPAKFSSGFLQEVGSTVLLFGAMRGAHAVTGRFTRSMAEGKWGSLFGGKASAEGAGMVVSPTGRILFDQISAKALTRTGEVVSSLANHAGGISSMYVAGALARRWKLQPESKQGIGGHWFDAALSYGQATVGFGLANSVSGGKFQSALAEVKLRLSEVDTAPASAKKEAASSEPAKKKDRPITLRSSKTALSKFLFKSADSNWPVEVKNVKRIWIGSGITGRGVEYEPDTALVDIGDKHGDVNQYHAVLMRDESNIFWYLADAGSSYGTYVDGKKLGSGESVIAKHGSLIQLGDHFQFRMEADGTLLEPDPRVTTTIVKVPIPKAQRRLEAPKAADAFPFDLAYPQLKIAADANVEVAELRDPHGLILPLRTGKPVWNLRVSSDKEPVARIYVDAKGRYVLQKLNPIAKVENSRALADGSEKRVTLEKVTKETEGSQPNIGRQDWTFLEPGDKFSVESQVFEFSTHPEPKGELGKGESGLILPPAMEEGTPPGTEGADSESSAPPPPPAPTPAVPATKSIPRPAQGPGRIAPAVPPVPPPRDPMPTPIAGADLGPVEPEVSENDRPTLVADPRAQGGLSDMDKTKPGVPFPIDIPDTLPDVLLAQIPEGQAPFVLVVGDKSVVADRKHTRYLLGSDPDPKDNQAGVVLEGDRIDPNHAQIFLGRVAGGDGTHQWFLSPHPHNTQGVYIDGYRALKSDERIPLIPGRTFALGDKLGERGGIKFTFEMPWQRRSSGVPEGVKPASRFPLELLAKLDEKAAPMILKANLGGNLFRANRSATRYVLGTGVGAKTLNGADPVEAKTNRVSLSGDKIAPEHCEIFIDAKGQWYIRALSETHPTYLKGKQLPVGELRFLYNGDSIELGGDAQDGVGVAFLFQQPDYAPVERVSKLPALIVPDEALGEDGFEVVDSSDVELSDDEPVYNLHADHVKTVTPPPSDPAGAIEEAAPKAPSGPHVLRSRRGQPPPFPQRPEVPAVSAVSPQPAPPQSSSPASDLKTGVYSAITREQLLQATAQPDEAPPTVQRPVVQPAVASPIPEVDAPDDVTAEWGLTRDDNTPGAGSPRAASVPPPVHEPQAAPAAPVDEADFGAVWEEVKDIPEASGNPEASGDVDPAHPAIPPPPAMPQVDSIETVRAAAPQQVQKPPVTISQLADLSQGDAFETVRADVPQQVTVTGRPSIASLHALHPELNSPAILTSIEPLLHSDRDGLSTALKAGKVFPQIGTSSPKDLLVSSTRSTGQVFGFFTKLAGYDIGEKGPRHPYSEELRTRLVDLVGLYYLSKKITQRFRLESDGVNLKFSAFPKEKPTPEQEQDLSGPDPDPIDPNIPQPNAVLALSVRKGTEPYALTALYHHFLTLKVPVEVIAPLDTSEMETPYAGVYFRSENAAEILAAVRELNQTHGELFLRDQWMPFSHPVLDAQGAPMAGIGVMEFIRDQNRSNPLEMKSYGVAKAFVNANRETKAVAKAQGLDAGKEMAADLGIFQKEILKVFSDLGVDLNNPGFMKGSAEGSHQVLVENSTPQQSHP